MNACSQYPNEIVELGLEDQYKEAKWQVYKFNLTKGNEFEVYNPFYIDSVYQEKVLSEFNLEFTKIEKKVDTTTYYFLFERGVSPSKGPYYGSASFWPNSDGMFGLNLYDRFGFILELKDQEDKFRNFIHSNQDKLSPFLECLAKEKKILKNI